MQRPPRQPKENLFAGGLISRILFTGALMAVASIVTQLWASYEGYGVKVQQTMVFTVLCFVQLANVLSVRSIHRSMFVSGLFANAALWGTIALTVVLQLTIVYVPFLQEIFKTEALDLEAMQIGLTVSSLCVFAIEVSKLVTRQAGR